MATSAYVVEYMVLDNGPHTQLVVAKPDDPEAARSLFFERVAGKRDWITVVDIKEVKDEATDATQD
jgi:hypothetical protein